MKYQFALAGLVAQAAALAVPAVNGRDVDIVGGQEANIEDFAYQANFYKNGQPHCGGTILDKNTILTAAHCTDGLQASSMTIYVGSKDLSGGTKYTVASFSQHPKFVFSTVDYDVSILKLSSDLTFGPTVKAIGGVVDTAPTTGSNATVSGWGSRNENEGDAPTLRYVSVPIVDHDVCNDDYKGDITDRMICAGLTEGGKDSCQGDSGGPFVANNKVVGIVSWGEGCARKNLPGVYTNVANEEIRSFIREKGGH